MSQIFATVPSIAVAISRPFFFRVGERQAQVRKNSVSSWAIERRGYLCLSLLQRSASRRLERNRVGKVPRVFLVLSPAALRPFELQQ
jgi:hypothetical protein